MRRAVDVVLPQVSVSVFKGRKLTASQCVLVSEILDLPSCMSSTSKVPSEADRLARLYDIRGKHPPDRREGLSSYRGELTVSHMSDHSSS
jgi:hypothetical protein